MFSSTVTNDNVDDDPGVDLLQFLSIVQRCQVDILPIIWHEGLRPFDAGGSSNISQSVVDAKTNFAFKRFIWRRDSTAQDFRYIAAEILTIKDASIVDHPNFVHLLGICWEDEFEPNIVKPVLVFPKAPLGNLRQFLDGVIEKDLAFRINFRLCCDVVEALSALHDLENVLVFRDETDQPLAKLIDFAYSGLRRSSAHLIYPPKTSAWVMAPEWHHRGFSLQNAKRLDCFSLGMTCLWVWFRNQISTRSSHASQDSVESMLHIWKMQNQLREIATSLVDEAEMESRVKQGIKNFLVATVGSTIEKRETNFGVLRQYLALNRQARPTLSGESDKKLPLEGHIDFHIPNYMLQLLWIDYRLRNAIKTAFEGQQNASCHVCDMNVAFQLSICYLAGFGSRRDEEKALNLLSTSGKTLPDLSLAMRQMETRAVFRGGSFLRLWNSGSIVPIELTSQYLNQQVLRTAETQLRGELIDFEVFAGQDHFLVSTAKTLLADVLFAKDSLSEAIDLYSEAVEMTKDVSGVKNLAASSVRLKLAFALEEQGRWQESEAVLRDLLEDITISQYAAHPSSILCLTALASVIGKQGRHEEAEVLDRETHDRCLEYFGKEHLNTVKATANLAVTLSVRGKVEEALAMEIEVVDMNCKVLGSEDLDTLISKANLAQTYDKLLEFEKARSLLEEVVAARTRLLGASHRDTLSCRADLANNYFRQQKFNEAALILSEVEAESEQTFSGKHPNYFSIKINLVEVLRKQGDLQKAYNICEKALEIAEQTLGEMDSNTMMLMAAKAGLYWDTGHVDYAVSVIRDLVDRNMEVYGPKNVSTLRNLHSLAVGIHKQGDSKGSRAIMEQVVRLRTEILGPEHKDTITSKQVFEHWISPREVDI